MPTLRYVWDHPHHTYLCEMDLNATIATYTCDQWQRGSAISMHSEGGASYFHYDGAGDTRDLTSAQDTITDTYLYSSAGESIASSGNTRNPFRFRSIEQGYTDVSLESIYFRRSHYVPLESRLLTPSPGTLGSYVAVQPEEPQPVQGNPWDYPVGAPALEPGDCAGTYCDELKGTQTIFSQDASCRHPCQVPVMEKHEEIHRNNFADCCALRNKCFTIALSARERQACFAVYQFWVRVNELLEEQLAAYHSCEKAYELYRKNCRCEADYFPVPGKPWPQIYVDKVGRGCCELLQREMAHLCYNARKDGELLCCPFLASGDPDLNCINKLREAAASQRAATRS